MNAIAIVSLLLVIIAQTANADDYFRKCKANTEPCLNIRCTATQTPIQVPFHLHYSCCQGNLFDQKKYACVRYRYGFAIKIALVQCDNCTQFTCGDGQCTMKEWKCNDVKDCLDGSDEIGCGPCASNQFYCRRARQCIDADKVCDKYNDCKDGSDEVYCPNKNTTFCGINYYRCSNGKQCIRWDKACDGYPDCDDNSDEAGKCSTYYIRKFGRKRDEISSFLDDAGVVGNVVDAAKTPVVS